MHAASTQIESRESALQKFERIRADAARQNHFEMDMRRNRHPIPRIGDSARLPHEPQSRTGFHVRAHGNIQRRQMRIKREAMRIAMLQHYKKAKARLHLNRIALDHSPRQDGINLVLRNPRGLIARILTACGAVGKLYSNRVPRRPRVKRRNVHAAMKSLAAIARPPGLSIIRVHPRPRDVSRLVGK